MKGLIRLGIGIAFACSAHAANEIQKVFHHRRVTDQMQVPAQVELGNLVFYFTKQPMVNTLPSVASSKNDHIFFFPGAELAGSAPAMVAAINASNNRFYAIRLEQVTVPTKGVKCIFTFDPKKVAVAYQSFESITEQQGLIFRFYNKSLIEDLSKQNKSMLRMAAAQQAPIIIDCGHGGHDHGKIGLFNLKEKDITRDVGLLVAGILEERGIPVRITRSDDSTVALDERTAFANGCNAQLFVSIHANAAANIAASGVETFCLSNGLFRQGFSTLSSQEELCAQRLALNYYAQSFRLASLMQHNVLELVKKKQLSIVDRRVKHSVAQVLVGTNMPGVLIEIGFLSNESEAKRLGDKQYQLLIAQGICKGILDYIKAV